jgi:hypothetical protein
LFKRFALLILCIIVLVLAAFGAPLSGVAVRAETVRTAGVEVGDWVKYGSFTASYVTNDPNATEEPLEIKEHNRIDWIENTVADLSGTTVSLNSVTRFENETKSSEIQHVDISTGDSSSDLRATFMFVAADLGEGDSVYSSDEFSAYKINETISQKYLGGISRKTNHLNVAGGMPVPGDTGEDEQVLVVSTDYYWDSETGILCEYLGSGSLLKGDYTTSWSMAYQIAETNIPWVEHANGQNDALPQEYPPGIVVAVVILVFAPIVFVLWRRRGRRRSRKTR